MLNEIIVDASWQLINIKTSKEWRDYVEHACDGLLKESKNNFILSNPLPYPVVDVVHSYRVPVTMYQFHHQNNNCHDRPTAAIQVWRQLN